MKCQSNKYFLIYIDFRCIVTALGTRGEMDITTVFGTVVVGSIPTECTREKALGELLCRNRNPIEYFL